MLLLFIQRQEYVLPPDDRLSLGSDQESGKSRDRRSDAAPSVARHQQIDRPREGIGSRRNRSSRRHNGRAVVCANGERMDLGRYVAETGKADRSWVGGDAPYDLGFFTGIGK